MKRRRCDMNWGCLVGLEKRSGVRAAIVARKCRNGHGAKGGRKVEAG
jgi:hypothetical protein